MTPTEGHVHRRNGDDLDPEIRSLGRISLPTWKVVIGGITWLLGLSGGVTANTVALKGKADADTVALQRTADRDILAERMQALDRRLATIEAYELRQTQAQEQAAAFAAAVKQAQERRR